MSLNDKEKAHENKFAYDQETQFKMTARRNKLFGLWAAEKMGLPEAKKDEYAKSVIRADFEEAGDEDVVGKVRDDLHTAGIRLTDHEIKEELHRCFIEAKKQIAG